MSGLETEQVRHSFDECIIHIDNTKSSAILMELRKTAERVLEIVIDLMESGGAPPSQHEIASAYGRQPRAVAVQLDYLESHGYVRRIEGERRNIRVLRWPDGAPYEPPTRNPIGRPDWKPLFPDDPGSALQLDSDAELVELEPVVRRCAEIALAHAAPEAAAAILAEFDLS